MKILAIFIIAAVLIIVLLSIRIWPIQVKGGEIKVSTFEKIGFGGIKKY